MASSKEFLYRQSHDETSRISSVTSEAIRTIQTIQSIGRPKFHSFLDSLRVFVASALRNIDKIPIETLDAVLNMVPEMACPKIGVGSQCQDMDDGTNLTVLGHYSDRKTLHFGAADTGFSGNVKGIDNFDEQAGFVVRDLKRLSPVLDFEQTERCKLLKNSIVYFEATLLRDLLEMNSAQLDYDKGLLFNSCFFRGLSGMIEELGVNYLDFLEENDLLGPFATKLVDFASRKLDRFGSVH